MACARKNASGSHPAPEGAGYQPPANVKITVVNEPTEALLLRGEIDALIPPNIVPSFRAKDPRIRRRLQRSARHSKRILPQDENFSDHAHLGRAAIALR